MGDYIVVENMLKSNFPLDTIVACSGILSEDILKLAQDLDIKIVEA